MKETAVPIVSKNKYAPKVISEHLGADPKKEEKRKLLR